MIKGTIFLQDKLSLFNAAYIRLLVKGAKDVVRSPYDKRFKENFLRRVSSEIQTIKLSSPYKMLSLKYYVRYTLLRNNFILFKYIVGGTAVFSFNRSRKKVELFS